MESNRAALQSRLDQLRARLQRDQENLAAVMELLRKADERQKTEPGNRTMWYRVLNNLEHSLIELRSRIQSSEIDIGKLENELAQLPEPETDNPPADSAEVSPGTQVGVSLAEPPSSRAPLPMEAAQLILARPVEEIAELTLQDVSSMFDSVAIENVAAAAPDAGQLMTTLEITGQTLGNDAANDTERRRQTALRCAIEKIQTKQIDKMTPEEVRMTLVCYESLTRRTNRTPKDERLSRILGAAIQIINRKRAKGKKE
jgi:hypothetical protein